MVDQAVLGALGDTVKIVPAAIGVVGSAEIEKDVGEMILVTNVPAASAPAPLKTLIGAPWYSPAVELQVTV
jgi:hypothetical protein